MEPSGAASAGRTTGPARGLKRTALVVGLAAAVAAGLGVPGGRRFVDETAYVTQAYFGALIAESRRDDWAWLEYHAYDLPPLPKYVVAAALATAGHPLPDRRAAGRWFRDTEARLVPEAAIVAARWPMAAFSGLGAAALFVLATVGAGDRRVGLLAAALLVLDPLYRLHGHRAMSEAPAEALTLASLAVGLIAWRRALTPGAKGGPAVVGGLAAVALATLAVLSKLTGGLAVLALGAWAALAIVAAPAAVGIGRRLAPLLGLAASTPPAFLLFVALNPYMSARPEGPPPRDLLAPAAAVEPVAARLERLVRHRVEVSRIAQRDFAHDATTTAADKLAAVAVQGFGRFGPLGPQEHDSTVPYPRYAWDRDAGAVLWLPIVAAGAVVLGRLGRRQRGAGEAPAAWAVLVYAGLALATVTAFLPLAWDRYLLPIQPAACVLGASALVAAWDAARRRIGGAR